MFRPLALLFVSVSMASAETPTDDRLTQLREFFRQKGAPVEHLAEEFLAAADRHSLDWRLLPSLAIIETAGGRVGKGNNLFGWGGVRFPTIVDGIHTVARALAEGRAYRGKTLEEKLKVYNPVGNFIQKVHKMMHQLGVAPQNSAANE